MKRWLIVGGVVVTMCALTTVAVAADAHDGQLSAPPTTINLMHADPYELLLEQVPEICEAYNYNVANFGERMAVANALVNLYDQRKYLPANFNTDLFVWHIASECPNL